MRATSASGTPSLNTVLLPLPRRMSGICSSAAIFTALDDSADRIDVPPTRRAYLLQASARAAVLEASAQTTS